MAKTKKKIAKAKKLKYKTAYLVTYNDCYGNGDTSIEAVLTKRSDFTKWLEEHNESRGAVKPKKKARNDEDDDDEDDDENEGEASWEGEEQFDIDSIEMVVA